VAGQRKFTKQEMYEDLRRAILEGQLQPGERLWEERLAEQYQLSRTPVREVLTRLEVEGLVEQAPHRGCFVRSFSPDELRDIYDMRVVLEGYAARRAALNLTEEQLSRLDQLNARMARELEAASPEADDGRQPPSPRRARRAMARIVEINQEFHRIIHEAANNAYLPLLLQRVIQLPLVYRALQLYGDQGLHVSLYHHRELVRSLRDRNPTWAEAVMTAHVMHGRAALLSYLHEADAPAGSPRPTPEAPGASQPQE